MLANFALNTCSAAVAILLFHPRQSLLELAQAILGSLRRVAARDHPPDEGGLVDDPFLSFANMGVSVWQSYRLVCDSSVWPRATACSSGHHQPGGFEGLPLH